MRTDMLSSQHRATRLLLELLWPLSAACANDCPGDHLVHRGALALHPALCRLAGAEQASTARRRTVREIAQRARNPGVHRRAGPGKLCGAHLVAAQLVVAAVQPGSGPPSPVSQLLSPWGHRVSPQLVRRTLPADGKGRVAYRTRRSSWVSSYGGPRDDVRRGSRHAEV